MGERETVDVATTEEGEEVAEMHPPHPKEEVEKGVRLGDQTPTPKPLDC